jgi:hypothetical protein
MLKKCIHLIGSRSSTVPQLTNATRPPDLCTLCNVNEWKRWTVNRQTWSIPGEDHARVAEWQTGCDLKLILQHTLAVATAGQFVAKLNLKFPHCAVRMWVSRTFPRILALCLALLLFGCDLSWLQLLCTAWEGNRPHWWMLWTPTAECFHTDRQVLRDLIKEYAISVAGNGTWNHGSILHLLGALCYMPKGRGFETRCGDFFSIYPALPASLGPGVHSASNRNEYYK